MSVFSIKNYYSNTKWDNNSIASSHHKAHSYLHKPIMTPTPNSAFSNLRNKLISLDLTHSKKNYFRDFLQNFHSKPNNISYMTTQQSSIKQSSIPKPKILQTQLSSNTSTSNASIRLCSQPDRLSKSKDKEDSFIQKNSCECFMGSGELITQRKINKTNKNIEYSKDMYKVNKHDEKNQRNSSNKAKKYCLNHPDKKGKFRKINSSLYENELYCSKCAMQLINKGIKIEDSEHVFRAQIDELLDDLNEMKPNINAHKEGLKLKKQDIYKFYDNQIGKIQNFYQALSQRLEAEKTSIMRSFMSHKDRAMEIYQSFEKELEKEEKELNNLKNNLMKDDYDDLEELTLKTQEKLISTRLNMNSRNKEFLSVYRTSGLNEKRLVSIKNQLFPLFDIVQIPTSILKKHIKSDSKTKIDNEACFSFENKGKNQISIKFKNILEKIKKNQARNSQLYMHNEINEKKFETPARKLSKAKSLPNIKISKDLKNCEEPFLTLIDNNRLNDSQITSNSGKATFQKTLFYSPNFKEI